jgi:NAD+ synthase (glutamine-hydrolysing)
MYVNLRVMFPEYSGAVMRTSVKKFVTLFMHSIFKWVQAPEAVHRSAIDLDRERALQLPTVHSMEWLELDEVDKFTD